MALYWSGPTAALTAVYVAGTAHTVDKESEHYAFFTIGGTAPVSVDLYLEVSMDGGTTWHPYALPEDELDGATTVHVYVFRTPPRCQARLSAKRTGGAADTTLTSIIYPRTPSDVAPVYVAPTGYASFAVENAAGTALDVEQAAGDIFEVEQAVGDVFDVDIDFIAGSAVADAASGVLPVSHVPQILSGPTSIIDDGAGADVAITDAYAANVSAWTNLDDACTDLAVRIDTSVDTPTSLELEILWHEAAAASAADASSFYMPVVNSVSTSTVNVGPEEISWKGRAAAALPVGSYRWSFERPAEASSYKVRVKRTGGANTKAQVWTTQVG